jgi:cell wall-associated NlpC family hydrolase
MFNIELFRQYAMRFVGINYKWGGDDPMLGMDCSGFAQELLEAFGAHPAKGQDLTAQSLYDLLSKTGSNQSTQVGAFAFYGKDFRRITHVAAIIGQDLIIEAGGGNSKTINAEVAAQQNAYIRVRPLHRRADLVATVLPKYP